MPLESLIHETRLTLKGTTVGQRSPKLEYHVIITLGSCIAFTNHCCILVVYTSRMPSIVGERERARCNKQMLILNDSLTRFNWIEDLVNVATFAEAAKVQCWITSMYNSSDWPQS